MRKVLIAVLSVLLIAFLVGCQESDSGDSSDDSSSDSAEQQQEALEEAQREITQARQAAEEARDEAERAREEAEGDPQEQGDDPDEGGAEDSSDSASSSEESAELSPVETLDLQYQFLNSGQYEKAYNLFAEQSQRLISLEQYSSAYAPTYEVSDYTVYSEQIQGDTATLEAELFVSGTQRGSHSYSVTQEFVREDGEWRVIMRDAQAETIANKTSGQDGSGEDGSDETQAGSSSGGGSDQGTIPGDGTFIVGEDIQPGTYETEGSEYCYWERLSGTSGTMDDVIANGVPTGPAIITISPSDEAFLTEGCSEWTLR